MKGLIDRVRGKASRHRTLLRFSMASSILEITRMAVSLVVLHWVEPAEMGLWQSLLLIQAYSVILQFGIFNGLNRELPLRLGAGENDVAMRLAATAQSVAIVAAMVLFLSGLAVPMVIDGEADLVIGALIVLVAAAAIIYRAYLFVTYCAAKAFEQLAMIRMWETGVLIVTLPLVYWYQFWGLAAQFLLFTVFGALTGHIMRPIRVPLRFSRQDFMLLGRVGVLIFIFGYLANVAYTFPRLILLKAYGTELVGLFAPVYAMIVLFRVLPNSIAQYVYPQMSYRLGANNDPRELWPMAWKTSIGIGVASIPFLFLGYLLAPWAIETLAPRYVESIPAVRWALLSGVLMGALVSISALYSLKAWSLLVFYTAVQLLATFLFPILMLGYISDPLEAVAAGFVAAHALTFVTGFWCIYRATHQLAGSFASIGTDKFRWKRYVLSMCRRLQRAVKVGITMPVVCLQHENSRYCIDDVTMGL